MFYSRTQRPSSGPKKSSQLGFYLSLVIGLCVIGLAMQSQTLPLIITAVAFGSFNVHLALLNNTTWVKGFLNGNAAKVVSMNTQAPPAAPKPQ